MKNKKNMWAIALFGLLVLVISSGIQTVSAGPLGGGDSFENATEIYSGYSADAWLDEGDEEYFYITGNPGQTLVVKGSIVSSGNGKMHQSIYDEDKLVLNALEIKRLGSGHASSSSLMTTSLSSEKEQYKLYIRTKAKQYGSWGGIQYRLDVSVEEHYDANSGTDAGDTFDTAMNITQGNYEGFLSGYYDVGHGGAAWSSKDRGNDHKDLYKLALESGEKINVKLIPSDDVKLNLKIYNEDRAEENSIQSPDTGVIFRTSWTAPSAQDVYVVIERAGDYPSGTYHMDLSVEPPGEHGLSITAFETPSTVAQGDYLKMDVNITKTASFEDWYTVVVSGVNENGYPLAGTSLVKLACDSVTVPVWIGIPPEAETGDYNLYADVYIADWDKIADMGPEVVNVTG
jgi:hypothetical protein